MIMNPAQWRHVFKLDPDKYIADEQLEQVCVSQTDAIIVGGTQRITFEKTRELLSRIRRYDVDVPCIQEVSAREAIVPGFDHYFVPFVLNATHPEWIIKPHVEAVKSFGAMIPWPDVSIVGYCVLNAESAVAQLTKSETRLSALDVAAYARMAVYMLHMPYFYLEYSGTYADPQFVQEVSQHLQNDKAVHLFYGGGIQGQEQAQQMSRFVQTIVVGNAVYEDFSSALGTVAIP